MGLCRECGKQDALRKYWSTKETKERQVKDNVVTGVEKAISNRQLR